MQPDSDSSQDSPRTDPENAAEAGGGRLHRLRQFFIARYVRFIDALSAALKRLRNRVKDGGGAAEQDDGKSEERPAHRKAKEPPPVAETPAPPRSAVRAFFIYSLVLVVGAIAGMLFASALLSTMVANQAQRIDDQREEIAQLEKQYARALESEVRYRRKLADVEAQLGELTKRTAAAPAEPPAIAPPRERQILSGKTGSCAVDNRNPAELARCLEEFNRKSGR